MNTMDEDHPHIHGEHYQLEVKPQIDRGSPPYTWGALLDYEAQYQMTRITPIYMGSTKRPTHRSECQWDHPHIHGEHNTTLGRRF